MCIFPPTSCIPSPSQPHRFNHATYTKVTCIKHEDPCYIIPDSVHFLHLLRPWIASWKACFQILFIRICPLISNLTRSALKNQFHFQSTVHHTPCLKNIQIHFIRQNNITLQKRRNYHLFRTKVAGEWIELPLNILEIVIHTKYKNISQNTTVFYIKYNF